MHLSAEDHWNTEALASALLFMINGIMLQFLAATQCP